MLAGEIHTRERSIARYQAELVDLRDKVAALDRTLALTDARVNPAAGGVVRATTGRYKGRGSLIAFVRDAVLASGSQGIDTTSLARLVISEFEIPAETGVDVQRYKQNSLKSALRKLSRQGDIELAPRAPGGRTPGVWRPKQGSSLADLARLASRKDAGDV